MLYRKPISNRVWRRRRLAARIPGRTHRLHRASGRYLFSGCHRLAVCSIESDRNDRSLPEIVASIEDILVTKNSLDGAEFLNLALANAHNGTVIARTGVFLSKGKGVDEHN